MPTSPTTWMTESILSSTTSTRNLPSRGTAGASRCGTNRATTLLTSIGSGKNATAVNDVLDPSDGRQPGRGAVFAVESRVNPGLLDGADVPSRAGIECCAQIFPADGVWAYVRANVAEAPHIEGAVALRHR